MGIVGKRLGSMGNSINSSLDSINRYYRDANIRDTANTLKQIQANQELEQARKNKDSAAEMAALQKKQILQRQAKTSTTLDTIYAIVVLLFLLGFGWLFIKFVFIGF